jgi:CubicO group peptidase (beta-lactamase class C family)
MPFDVFLKKHLFDPLGMHDTWFYLPKKSDSRLVSVQYKSSDGKWSRYPITWYDPDYPIKGERRFFSGGGGLSSTAKDYASFVQMYINGGELNGKRFLSSHTVQVIMSNQIGNLWGENPDNYYGLAFAVTTQRGQDKGGQGNVGSFGWGGYFDTQYFGDPKEQIVGILMKQIQGAADDTDWKFRILVEQAVDD